ncbi:MAG: class II aldolase/adducin family protein [Acidobacteria bacterium]|nr:class II aldolase/adducin family protein [Acidobacteriota bacterium]
MADTESKLVAALVTANRILANEGILDVFGHISVRSERNPDEFLLSCSRAPAAVSARDIMRYRLDGSQITRSSAKPYVERIIHGAIFQARADVQAVCHGHSDGILPFAASGEVIRPVIHVGTMFWNGVGWFDRYDEGGNMLVASPSEGRALAEALGPRRGVLLRNHGFAVVGGNLAEAVMAAIYLDKNASIQSAAARLGRTLFIGEDEARRGSKVFQMPAVQERAWGYWVARLPHGWKKEAGLAPSPAAKRRLRPSAGAPRARLRPPAQRSGAKTSGARRGRS